MRLSPSASQRGSLAGRLRLARLLAMDDEEYSRELAKLEADPRFGRLKESGVVTLAPFSKAAFAARRFPGWRLGAPAEGAAELLDAESPAARLVRRVGSARFEACFLKGDGLSRAEKARRCGLSVGEARQLEDFLTRLWVREELAGPAAAAPAKGFATVAGFVVEDGRPALRFFHRDAWRGRWKVDEDALRMVSSGLDAAEAETLGRFAARLAHTDKRKTTLLRVLEALLEAQRGFLVSGDPSRLVPLTQRSVAAAVGADPSVVNRLAANKAVALPWGTEAPLKSLMPSAKLLGKALLAELAAEGSGLSDEELRAGLAARGFAVSRRSVTQYRADLGLKGRGKR